jgi:hypothetical protein
MRMYTLKFKNVDPLAPELTLQAGYLQQQWNTVALPSEKQAEWAAKKILVAQPPGIQAEVVPAWVH